MSTRRESKLSRRVRTRDRSRFHRRADGFADASRHRRRIPTEFHPIALERALERGGLRLDAVVCDDGLPRLGAAIVGALLAPRRQARGDDGGEQQQLSGYPRVPGYGTGTRSWEVIK